MSDEEWAFHQHFIPAVHAPYGRKPTDHRLVLDAIFEWTVRGRHGVTCRKSSGSGHRSTASSAVGP